MPEASDHKARWTAGLYSLVFSLLLLASCATAPSSRTHVGPRIQPGTPASTEESFQALWEKWTVRCGAGPGGRTLGFLSTPFSMAGSKGPGGGGGEFPLSITATLMDSVVIETGLQHFANLTEMTPEEERAFRNRYADRYDPMHICSSGVSFVPGGRTTI